jgi:acyl-CoA synthetase (AMP-forming)/AMP-acid ligase II
MPGPELPGLMTHRSPGVAAIAERAENLFGGPVVSRAVNGIGRTDYASVVTRARRVASALKGMGVGPGDRVATLTQNSRRHLELYLAVRRRSCSIPTSWKRRWPRCQTSGGVSARACTWSPVTAPIPALDDAREFLSDRLPSWTLPGQVVPVSAIPRTSVGELVKRALRARLWIHSVPRIDSPQSAHAFSRLDKQR